MTAGIDEPDRRGRTGLDREGFDLTGNPDVVVKEVTLLSSHWYILRTTEFEYRHRDGRWTTEHRTMALLRGADLDLDLQFVNFR